MTYIREQREIFWKLFDKILKEKGEPFKIAYIHQIQKDITSYAAVNRNGSFNANAIDLSFLPREKMFRVNIYISSARLIRKFMDNKELVNSMITSPILWDNGKSVLRPSVYFEFIPGDVDNYKKTIENSLSTIQEFIEVANIFGKDEFFDIITKLIYNRGNELGYW